jgi:hypothetical protein
VVGTNIPSLSRSAFGGAVDLKEPGIPSWALPPSPLCNPGRCSVPTLKVLYGIRTVLALPGTLAPDWGDKWRGRAGWGFRLGALQLARRAGRGSLATGPRAQAVLLATGSELPLSCAAQACAALCSTSQARPTSQAAGAGFILSKVQSKLRSPAIFARRSTDLGR